MIARRFTQVDPRVLDGFGVRPYNWEFSASVQHEDHRRYLALERDYVARAVRSASA
jgi:hypothetical protein